MKSILRESEKKIAKTIVEIKLDKEASSMKNALTENFLSETFSDFVPLLKEKNLAEKLKEERVQSPVFASYYRIVNETAPLTFLIGEKTIKDNYTEFKASLAKTKNVSENDLKEVLSKIETGQEYKCNVAPLIYIDKLSIKRDRAFPNILALDLSITQRVINEK
jgi:hypothetical protein